MLLALHDRRLKPAATFILDEVDKIGADFRVDPSSALLEVLDPEQNNSFSDHYLDVGFDLSKGMFITPANFLDPIPPPLRDRMEVLELPGYTEEEKLEITFNYLIPRQLEAHGLTPEQFTITPDAVRRLIASYTREAGLRNLEREIASLCRGAGREIVEGVKTRVEITPGDLAMYLGPPHFFREAALERPEPGVATGLAWTPTGGDILFMVAFKAMVWTLISWGLSVAAGYTFLFIIFDQPTLQAALAFIVLGAFSVALPAVPGNLGSFEASVVGGLWIGGLITSMSSPENAPAVAFAGIQHGVMLGIYIILGIIGLYYEKASLSQITQGSRALQQNAAQNMPVNPPTSLVEKIIHEQA